MTDDSVPTNLGQILFNPDVKSALSGDIVFHSPSSPNGVVKFTPLDLANRAIRLGQTTKDSMGGYAFTDERSDLGSTSTVKLHVKRRSEEVFAPYLFSLVSRIGACSFQIIDEEGSHSLIVVGAKSILITATDGQFDARLAITDHLRQHPGVVGFRDIHKS